MPSYTHTIPYQHTQITLHYDDDNMKSKGYHPFATADQYHFKKPLKRLCPAYDVPSSDLVGGRLLNDLHDGIQSKVNKVCVYNINVCCICFSYTYYVIQTLLHTNDII